MGFDDAKLVLDSHTYTPGQMVNGKLIFDQKKVKKFRGIYVKLKGTCEVRWTTNHSRTVNGKSQSYTVTHESHEEYVNHKLYLVGSEHGDHEIKAGHHEFPFQMHLPPHCPSSFEGSKGHVRYHVKAVVDRAFKLDQEKSVDIRVVAPIDLNFVAGSREPINFELAESYSCCCVSSGAANIVAKIPRSGFCAGEVIPIELSVQNRSNVEIDTVRFGLKRSITFYATSGLSQAPTTKNQQETIAKVKKGPIAGNTNRNWIVEMTIPQMDVHNLDNCQYIDIVYELEIKVSPANCHSDTTESTRIIMGTIPLRLENPGQMPSEIQHQQPINQAYPVPSPPYPGPNPPYPQNSPYPSGNSPYPIGSPYPASPPYPGQNPPFSHPMPMPFPSASPPYPNAQYPGSPPYPGPAPYPQGPGLPPPAYGSDKPVMPPMLPLGSNVPLPKSPGNTPYGAASAPEPGTPDEKKPMLDDSMPYNPQYVSGDNK